MKRARRTPIIRKVLAGFFIVAALAGVAIYPLTAAAIGLNQNAMVQGNVVTLGDVFTGLTKDSDKILGPAPLPGKQMTLDARTLLKIALALDLPWRPQSESDVVVLKRAATIIGGDMIDKALKDSLETKGVSGDYRFVFDEGDHQIVLPQNSESGVEVTAMNYQPEKNYFEADLAAPSKSNPIATERVAGHIERVTKVPVLHESIGAGTIIGASDIDFIEVPDKELGQNYILKADDLVGMTPRLVLQTGQPVTPSDIMAPKLISRGDVVMMVFNRAGLQLTAEGKALEDGAKGDHIRIMNISSNKTVTAEVSTSREVILTE